MVTSNRVLRLPYVAGNRSSFEESDCKQKKQARDKQGP